MTGHRSPYADRCQARAARHVDPRDVPVPGRWELPDIGGLRGQGLPGIDAGVTLAVMSMLPGVLCDVRRGALDDCVPAPEVSNEGSEFGGTFERGEGA